MISLLFVSVISGANPQPQYSRFNHLTVNDGLSSNRIRCIYRDNKDYLWIGTDVGLDKYDSYEMKKYRHDENSQDRSVVIS